MDSSFQSENVELFFEFENILVKTETFENAVEEINGKPPD